MRIVQPCLHKEERIPSGKRWIDAVHGSLTKVCVSYVLGNLLQQWMSRVSCMGCHGKGKEQGCHQDPLMSDLRSRSTHRLPSCQNRLLTAQHIDCSTDDA